jgi:hypothetical protein
VRQAPSPPRARLAVVGAGLALAVAAVIGALDGGGDDEPARVPVVPTAPGASGKEAEPVPDPFAWRPERSAELERRAAVGNSHLLYTLSPGGAIASAERTARWRPLVERAAAEAGVNADTLEGLVFLESAGRDDARAPGGLESAAGLTQILAETAQNLLGMRVDLQASSRYTRRLERAQQRGQERRATAAERALRRVDQRFDPEQALAGTARYLTLARERFGREDFAFVSYHMGIGNLEGVLRDYAGPTDDPIRDVIEDEGLTYARVYFDSTPTTHAPAYRRLAGLGDDSSNYLWKIAAARDIMSLWRTDRPALERLAALHAAGASAEDVLHPPDQTQSFTTPDELQRAWDAGALVAFPDAPAGTGLRRDPRMGDPVHRGLRPEALAVALYIGAEVRAISGRSPLVVTAAVGDALTGGHDDTIHTTGWAFDVARDYRSRRQALAFQFVLDRLQSLNAIAWVRTPAAIHITASADVEPLLPLLDRVG